MRTDQPSAPCARPVDPPICPTRQRTSQRPRPRAPGSGEPERDCSAAASRAGTGPRWWTSTRSRRRRTTPSTLGTDPPCSVSLRTRLSSTVPRRTPSTWQRAASRDGRTRTPGCRRHRSLPTDANARAGCTGPDAAAIPPSRCRTAATSSASASARSRSAARPVPGWSGRWSSAGSTARRSTPRWVVTSGTSSWVRARSRTSGCRGWNGSAMAPVCPGTRPPCRSGLAPAGHDPRRARRGPGLAGGAGG